MKQSLIDALSGTPFTSAEVTRTRNIIVDKDFATTKLLLESLTLYDTQDPPVALAEAEQSERKLMRSHLKVYFDKFLDGTLAAKGGKRGADFDNIRDKTALRREVRRMLGLTSLTDEEQEEFKKNKRLSQSIRTTRSFN